MQAPTMKRILVAIDLSDPAASSIVIESACDLARSTTGGATIRLLHIFTAAGETATAHEIREAKEALVRCEGEDVLSEYRDGEGVSIRVVPPSKPTWAAICDAAKEGHYDAVVVGAHRHSLIERALGTTAAKVVSHAECPVTVVRCMALPRNSEQLALLKASAIAGATGGAAVGAIGGPPGVVIGGALGAAAGFLVGSVLDTEEHRASKHDHELDDAIGVTKGDLGAAPLLPSSPSALVQQPKQSKFAELREEAARLRTEHRRLDTLCESLLEAYRNGDWRDVAAQWKHFETMIRTHLDTEEQRAFAMFREVDPAEAELLLAEHAELREKLSALGVNIELHALPHTDAEELVRRVRAHAAREERLFYPWVDDNDDNEVVGGSRSSRSAA